jgi:predicted house-cleaning noncanonical NTP pyrophosphatase (MazG superfamily)
MYTLIHDRKIIILNFANLCDKGDVKMGSKIFKNEILVRDKRIKFLEDLGGRLETKKLSKEEIQDLLNDKILEEAKELYDAIKSKDKEEILKEYSDVLEVLDNMKFYLSLTDEEINKVKDYRKKEFGGYKEGSYIETIEIDEDNPLIDYYLARPEKYPKIDKQKD